MPPLWRRRLQGQARGPAEEGPDRDLRLGPGERRAEADVDPASEGQVVVIAAPEVEAVGIVEVRGIAVRGAYGADDDRACSQYFSVAIVRCARACPRSPIRL